MAELTIADLCRDQTVYQLGIEPHRIDILTGIDGVRFKTAWPRRAIWEYGHMQIPVLGRPDLIRAKKATKRPQDLLDLQQLITQPKRNRGTSRKGRARRRKRKP